MKSRLSILRKITRAIYVLAVIFLLSGVFLSMINVPVSAASHLESTTPTNEPVDEEPTEVSSPAEPTEASNPAEPTEASGPTEPTEVSNPPEPEVTASPVPEKTAPAVPENPNLPTPGSGEGEDPENGRPVFKGATPTPETVETQTTDKNPDLNGSSNIQKKVKQAEGVSVSFSEGMAVIQAAIEGEVGFTASDQSLCQYEEGWIDATAVVSLPEGITAKLVTSWYVVHPSELNPGGAGDKHYSSYDVQNGDSVTYAAWWPGVRVGDDVVEIHWGVALVYNGEVIDTGSLDYYWYDWVCQAPTLTPVPTEGTPENTAYPDTNRGNAGKHSYPGTNRGNAGKHGYPGTNRGNAGKHGYPGTNRGNAENTATPVPTEGTPENNPGTNRGNTGKHSYPGTN